MQQIHSNIKSTFNAEKEMKDKVATRNKPTDKLYKAEQLIIGFSELQSKLTQNLLELDEDIHLTEDCMLLAGLITYGRATFTGDYRTTMIL